MGSLHDSPITYSNPGLRLRCDSSMRDFIRQIRFQCVANSIIRVRHDANIATLVQLRSALTPRYSIGGVPMRRVGRGEPDLPCAPAICTSSRGAGRGRDFEQGQCSSRSLWPSPCQLEIQSTDYVRTGDLTTNAYLFVLV